MIMYQLYFSSDYLGLEEWLSSGRRHAEEREGKESRKC
jgi:hypothetical protein